MRPTALRRASILRPTIDRDRWLGDLPAGYARYTGAGDAGTLNLVYNLADFVNKIAFGVVIWAAATATTQGVMKRRKAGRDIRPAHSSSSHQVFLNLARRSRDGLANTNVPASR